MRILFVILAVGLATEPLSAQLAPGPFYISYPPSHRYTPAKYPANFHRPSTSLANLSSTHTATPLWQEMGYIMAMQSVFTGMSYLGSQKKYGPAIAGSFDLLMGLAGLANIPHKKTSLAKMGYGLISAGFLAKSLYNFSFGKNHDKGVRFWTNYIGFNVLVYTGYGLDSLD